MSIDRGDEVILHNAIDFYGSSVQELKAMEELSELIRAIARAMTCDVEERDTALENLAEEMADVEIMLEQLKIINNNRDKIKTWRYIKLGRLRTKMAKDKEKGGG